LTEFDYNHFITTHGLDEIKKKSELINKEDVCMLVSTRSVVDKINAERTIAMVNNNPDDCPAYVFRAINSNHAACVAKSDDTFAGLRNRIYLCINCPVMLTQNISTLLGLCNGTAGVVFDILFTETGDKNSIVPLAVLVKVKKMCERYPTGYKGESCLSAEEVAQCYGGKYIVPFDPLTEAIIPVELTTSQCSENGSLHRSQFPLVARFAMTIHKSQGITLDAAILDIGDDEFCSGLLFVAMSRVTHPDNLAFSKIPTFERVTDFIKRKKSLRSRRAHEEILGTMAIETKTLRHQALWSSIVDSTASSLPPPSASITIASPVVIASTSLSSSSTTVSSTTATSTTCSATVSLPKQSSNALTNRSSSKIIATSSSTSGSSSFASLHSLPIRPMHVVRPLSRENAIIDCIRSLQCQTIAGDGCCYFRAVLSSLLYRVANNREVAEFRRMVACALRMYVQYIYPMQDHLITAQRFEEAASIIDSYNVPESRSHRSLSNQYWGGDGLSGPIFGFVNHLLYSSTTEQQSLWSHINNDRTSICSRLRYKVVLHVNLLPYFNTSQYPQPQHPPSALHIPSFSLGRVSEYTSCDLMRENPLPPAAPSNANFIVPLETSAMPLHAVMSFFYQEYLPLINTVDFKTWVKDNCSFTDYNDYRDSVGLIRPGNHYETYWIQQYVLQRLVVTQQHFLEFVVLNYYLCKYYH
jgi:hypothetical protein